MKNEMRADHAPTENCFTEENFDRVHGFLKGQIKGAEEVFYKHDGYEFHLGDTGQIDLKKDRWTLARISRERGVVSLAKREKDNSRILKETNQLFCQLLELAEP